MSAVPVLSKPMSSSLEMGSPPGSKTWNCSLYPFFASSLWLLNLGPFPAWLAHHLCYHCAKSAIVLKSAMPRPVSLRYWLCWKETWDHTDWSPCKWLLPLLSGAHWSSSLPLTSSWCHIGLSPVASPKMCLICVVISQDFALTLFSLSSSTKTHNSSASTTTSEQMTL